mmetsp:Transcript_63450/g.127232  ORF Transcript_63450/g.127232 Transcript_63450/m.127232 type:complete len:196 (-) Transcript_63450:166-753(-)
MRCAEECQSRGFCCNDFKIGSNQMISCAQACMIRARGTTKHDCEGHCDRHEQSGCSETVGGHTYHLCQDCEDLTNEAKCHHGVQSPLACETGCSIDVGDSGFLKVGDVATFDLFYAERHCCGSNFHISTSLDLVEPEPATTTTMSTTMYIGVGILAFFAFIILAICCCCASSFAACCCCCCKSTGASDLLLDGKE